MLLIFEIDVKSARPRCKLALSVQGKGSTKLFTVPHYSHAIPAGGIMEANPESRVPSPVKIRLMRVDPLRM